MSCFWHPDLPICTGTSFTMFLNCLEVLPATTLRGSQIALVHTCLSGSCRKAWDSFQPYKLATCRNIFEHSLHWAENFGEELGVLLFTVFPLTHFSPTHCKWWILLEVLSVVAFAFEKKFSAHLCILALLCTVYCLTKSWPATDLWSLQYQLFFPPAVFNSFHWESLM